MRFHVLAVCHTVSNKDYVSCAFTQKVVKFCEMMMKSTPEEQRIKSQLTVDEIIRHPTIHEIIHYGHERSDVACDEHVTVMTDEILIKTYGEYNWKKEFFKHRAYDLTHNSFTENGIREVSKRRRAGDFILCFWGLGGRHVAEAFPECLGVEPGIGYPTDTCFANYRVYESYAIMHNHYGADRKIHPGWYDCVIPNYFDPRDFNFVNEKSNYFLYLGRITKIKGLDVIMHLAKTMGFRLLIAGQGSIKDELGYETLPPNVEYVGFADIHKRKELMGNAKALFLPTAYIEPFGGVTMEAMMSGTPVITTDWGVFSETVLHGVTGYRCRTIDQFEWAIRNIDQISPAACREWAMKNYSMDRIRGMYEEYFDMLIKLKFSKGFTQTNHARSELNWLKKEYPVVTTENKVPRKPKICLFTEGRWAFGRIAQAIQKYCFKYDIDIYDWSQGIPNDISFCHVYDLIYTTVWDIGLQLEQKYPSIKDKIVFSGHGLVDFVKLNFDLKNIVFNEKQMSEFNLEPQLVEWLQNRKAGFSVVSTQLKQLLNKYDMPNLHLTECGVDPQLFTRKPTTSDRLRVVYTLPATSLYNESTNHGYNSKRQWLVQKIKDRLFNEGSDIEFIFPKDFLKLDQMSQFYQQGDVWLCVSHTEGNPLGAFEAGACGLTVISTKVGVIPELIKDGVNGYIIENEDVTQIENDIVEKLYILDRDRKLLNQMKENMYQTIQSEWTWTHKIKQWESFFDQALNKLSH